MKRRYALILIVLALVIAAFWGLHPHDRQAGEAPAPQHPLAADSVERGRELVVLADCKACHTERAGGAFAGGRSISTPFGTFFSPNITPDADTGIGVWNADDFWHALHNGYARGGAPLYPTFPYTNYTKISRSDSDAMFAYLRTIPPVRQVNREHDLAFPFNQRWLLLAWRALFFRPGVYETTASRSAEWNRGAYVVQGLAHCSACHEARNALGAIQSKDNPAGGLVLNWYAPVLTNSGEAGVRTWNEGDIVTLLKQGQTNAPGSAQRASTLGPMAEVVYESLQHAQEEDLHSIAVYLKSLPESRPASGPPSARVPDSAIPGMLDRGTHLYADHCARCHGDRGEGRAPAATALAGNRAVNMSSAVNPIRIVLYGGFPPGTEGNPRPFGMPPFLQTLHSDEIADVLTYVRTSWGNTASPVSANDVDRNRTGPLW